VNTCFIVVEKVDFATLLQKTDCLNNERLSDMILRRGLVWIPELL